MFEVEDLFDITKQGAFSNKEEFLNFAKEATKEELFDLMEVGAFSSIEEFKSSFSEKKKSSRYSFKWGKGCYGIHYKNGNNSYIFGFFRSKHTS